MATYQEQIEARKESKVAKAMVACAELATVNEGLALLERDGVIREGHRLSLLRQFVAEHPEINEALKKGASQS